MRKSKISPENLKTLRNRKDLTQQQLADKSGVTSRTIVAIEKSNDEQRAVQDRILKMLAKALLVKPEVLAGEEPLPAEGKPADLHIKLSPQVKLNFDLLKKKYGVDIEDIINVAPLLFVAAAEESLQRQQGEIKKAEKEYGKSSNLRHQTTGNPWPLSHPYLIDIPEGLDASEYFEGRYRAVKKKDLFESFLREVDGYLDLENNPFADYLHDLSLRTVLKDTVEVEVDLYAGPFNYSFSQYVPNHSVCLDTLEQITLGSENAGIALKQGIVSISEIPQDLWEPRRAGERVAWLEDMYNDAIAKEDTEPDLSENEFK